MNDEFGKVKKFRNDGKRKPKPINRNIDKSVIDYRKRKQQLEIEGYEDADTDTGRTL